MNIPDRIYYHEVRYPGEITSPEDTWPSGEWIWIRTRKHHNDIEYVRQEEKRSDT